MSSWIDVVNKECSWIRIYYDVLANLINERKYTSVLEIGVAYGGHAQNILEKCPNVQYIGVDPYQARYDTNDYLDLDVHRIMGGRDIQHSMDMMHDRVLLRLSPYEDRCKIMRQHSWEAAPYIEDGSLDCVFIDGDHREEAVKRDLELYWPKVKKGGVMAGDDLQIKSVEVSVVRFGAAKGLKMFRLYKEGRPTHWAFERN